MRIDRRYNVSETLGSGGMSTVYLAHDEVLGRDVALKVLNRELTKQEEFVERFRREARSAAALSHPNIVQVYDRGESEDGDYYIAMEYVPRGTLKDRIQHEGQLGTRTAVEVAVQIAEALKEAHEHGVIHRDIKPQNVLVTTSGDVKVADFGIARAASSPTMTRENLALGTAAYMSPEQATGEKVGPTSDLYSLGAVMYEMLTGEPPYKGNEPLSVAMRHVNDPAPSPGELAPGIPEDTNDLVVQLLAKDPKDRPESAEALIPALRQSLETPANPRKESAPTTPAGTRPTAVYPESRGERPARRPEKPRRRRTQPRNLVPWLLVVLFVAAVIGGGILVLRVLGAPIP